MGKKMKYKKGDYIKIKTYAHNQKWYIDKPLRIIGFDKNNYNKDLYVVDHVFNIKSEKSNMILEKLVFQDEECLEYKRKLREEKIKRLIHEHINR